MPKILNKVYFFIFLLLAPLLGRAADFSETYEKLYNPLPENQLVCLSRACDLAEFFILIIRDILQIIPIVSVLFILVGAFQMISSAGNEERLIKAKKTIQWAVLGLVFALLSFSIVAIVRNILSANT